MQKKTIQIRKNKRKTNNICYKSHFTESYNPIHEHLGHFPCVFFRIRMKNE